METDFLDRTRIHHGHNIRRLRNEKKITQETMAKKVCLSQQTVSRYETTRIIDDEMLDRFAKALEVSVDTIKTLEEGSDINFYIENNTFHAGSHISPFSGDVDHDNVYNPIEKIIEMCNEKSELYERMLNLEKEKITMLEQLLKDNR